MTKARTPRLVLVYGLLGLIPFLAPPLIGAALPASKDFAVSILAQYGALILSFLGGARWGLTVGRAAPDPRVVSLSMLPTLFGLALLLAPNELRLPGLAAALALHWFWDVRGSDLPVWYPALRSELTGGAVIGLLAGWLVLT